MRFFSRVRMWRHSCVTRFPRSLRALPFGYRGAAELVPVPLGPGFFLYTLSECISPSRTCIRTHWDMWDHWDHPYLSTGCWSQASSSVPLSTGTARR